MLGRFPKMKILLILAENSWQSEMKVFPSELFDMETRVSLRYFVSYCLCKHSFDSNLLQTSSNLISLTILVTLKLSALF